MYEGEKLNFILSPIIFTQGFVYYLCERTDY